MRVWTSLVMVVALIFSSVVVSAPVWAGPQPKRVRVAQANTNANVVQKSKAPANNFPTGAWTLESLSAAVAGAGFVFVGVGVSFLTRRDQLLGQASEPNRKPEDIPSATEIRSLEDTGTGMLVGGWIATGVGLAGMVIGAIWLLAHKPSNTDLPPLKEGSAKGQAPQPFTGSSTILSIQP
ncbi:MAG: hypothetical protein EP343_06890 [Deltaproteobacteria bacterium]|nr:MAG: hypothetical protein EP343_06890 [Deltaproteobacteria bacterium]